MQFIFTKLGSTFLIVIAIVFVYFAYSAIGDTTVNVTLKTNNSLEDGLVGHWTFDGKDITGDGETWYDQGYTYKRALTITAGGTSGGAATTTTNGYAILATTTLSTLMATSSGGNVEKLDANNNLPYDIIFTDDDDTTLLDYHIESYASTTGAIVAWIEVENISSTTDQTFHMYYGNASATDQSDETGTYNSTYAGVWHLSEDPSGSAPQMLDSTANNNDGTSAGSMTTSQQVAGQIDGNLDFDGDIDRIAVPSDPSLEGLSNMTVSAWFNADVAGDSTGRRIISKGFSSGSDDYALRYTDTNIMRFYTSNTGNVETGAINTGQWYHVVGVYDGSVPSNQIYLDGVLVGTETATAPSPPISDNNQDFAIGKHSYYQLTTANRVWNGLIDEVRVYNTALHPMDILTDYNMMVDNTTFLSWGAEDTFSGGTATDVSGQGNDGTINLVNSARGVLGQALEFDGVDDYVSISGGGSLNITDVVTITMWVKWRGDDSTSNPLIKYYDVYGFAQLSDGTMRLYYNSDTGAHYVASNTDTDSSGGWTFITGVIDSGGDVTYYVNGNYDNSAAFDGSSIDAQPSKPVRIGAGGGTTLEKFFDGLIDDVRIYNRALSAEEIKRLYELGGTTKINTTINTNPTLEDGLVGHWTMDGKDMYSNVADISGQGNNGALELGASGNTSTTTAIGVLGQALEFDGVDDYVDVGTWNLSGSSLTLSAWFNTNSVAECGGRMISKSEPGSSLQNHYWMISMCNDEFRARIKTGGTTTTHVTTAENLSVGTWYYGVVTYDGARVKLYIDGVEVLNEAKTGTLDTSSEIIAIGRNGSQSTESSNTHFNGLIDDVRIYNRALSAEEISRLYELGATTKINKTLKTNNSLEDGLVGHWTMDGKDMYSNVADTSGQGNNGALELGASGNTSTTTAIGVLGQALEFDGTDDAVLLGLTSDIIGTDSAQPFTVSAWAKADAIPSVRYGMVSSYDNSSGTNGFDLRLENGGSPSNGAIFSIAGFTNAGVFATADFVETDWNHYVGRFDGSNIEVFVNAVIGGTTSTGALNGTDRNIFMGQGFFDGTPGTPVGDRAFDGKLDDVRIYNRALSAEEISRLYELGI